jgi:hypothetical protein
MAERFMAAVLKTDSASVCKPHQIKQILLLANGLRKISSSLVLPGFHSISRVYSDKTVTKALHELRFIGLSLVLVLTYC